MILPWTAKPATPWPCLHDQYRRCQFVCNRDLNTTAQILDVSTHLNWLMRSNISSRETDGCFLCKLRADMGEDGVGDDGKVIGARFRPRHCTAW